MDVVAAPPRFEVGDRVRLRDSNGKRATWVVAGIDTNKTPVHDPEPAYRLIGPSYHRYAYESDLVPA